MSGWTQIYEIHCTQCMNLAVLHTLSIVLDIIRMYYVYVHELMFINNKQIINVYNEGAVEFHMIIIHDHVHLLGGL